MIQDVLFDWQRELIKPILNKKAYGLFLDMGLGKTVVSYALAEYHNVDKVLIITINTKATEDEGVRGSWSDWGTKFNGGGYTVHRKSEKFSGSLDKEIFVVNYEYLFKREKVLDGERKKTPVLRQEVAEFIDRCKGKKVAVIIDESHRMKESSSTQSKIIFKIQEKLNAVSLEHYYYLLTGTPFTTGFYDLLNQLKFLGYQTTNTAFKEQFCKMGHYPSLPEWRQPIVGYKNIDELFKIVHNYSITVKSDEVVKLPDSFEEYHIITENPFLTVFSKQYLKEKDIVKHNVLCCKSGLPYIEDIDELPRNVNGSFPNPWYRNIDYPKENWLADTAALYWLRSRQLSIGFQGNDEEYKFYDYSRLNAVCDFLADNPDNYVVFYNYSPEFYELYWKLDALGYNIDVYNGEIKSLDFYDKYENQSEEERFSNKKNIILANFASGSTGKNWQLYSKCVIASLPLYKDWEQGLKRIKRVGSKDPITYHIFMSNTVVDRGMKNALDHKIDYNEDMFMSDMKSSILKGE